MKHLLTLIIVSILSIAAFLAVYGKSFDSSLSLSTEEDKTDLRSKPDTSSDNLTDFGEEEIFWFDTVMYAKGHAFGYSGDVSMWGGWYIDTVCVGNDQMLTYDSVSPSSLKLSLVTREVVVDLGEAEVIDRIQRFMDPIDGFRRYVKRYEECLDTLYYEGYGYDEYMGGFSFEIDYPDSCNVNVGKINRFICDLAGISESEKAKVPGLSAFYAGFNPTKYYRPVYTGNANDMKCLSDFLAHKTFENWKRGGEFGMGSSEATLAIRPHIANERYVTFSKYEYDRQGIGHGMYTETFHTFDLNTGNRLRNIDIFKPNSFEQVKMKLFEVMAKDPHYLEWHGETVSASEIELMIEAWQSPSPILEGTEWEEPKREFRFELPEGALTDSGIVFSFQPYEIDCWTAGAFHFIVPYKMLMPFLTQKIKELVDRKS